MSKEEFHKILTKMLNEGKIQDVKKILTQRSVVERGGDELIGIDYIDKFKEDFENGSGVIGYGRNKRFGCRY